MGGRVIQRLGGAHIGHVQRDVVKISLREQHHRPRQQIGIHGHGAVLGRHIFGAGQQLAAVAADGQVRKMQRQRIQRGAFVGRISLVRVQRGDAALAGAGDGLDHLNRAHGLERACLGQLALQGDQDVLRRGRGQARHDALAQLVDEAACLGAVDLIGAEFRLRDRPTPALRDGFDVPIGVIIAAPEDLGAAVRRAAHVVQGEMAGGGRLGRFGQDLHLPALAFDGGTDAVDEVEMARFRADPHGVVEVNLKGLSAHPRRLGWRVLHRNGLRGRRPAPI